MVELTDDQLEGISGGYLFQNEKDEWEVIDDGNGEVLASFSTDLKASTYAKSIGMSTKAIDWEDLASLRGLDC